MSLFTSSSSSVKFYFNIHCIISILIICLPSICALISFQRTYDHNHQYHTYDPYRVDASFYNVTGLLIKPTFLPNTFCTLAHNITDVFNGIFNTRTYNISSSIVLIDEFEAGDAGCKSIVQAVHSLASYDDWYRKQGGAPILATVYMLRTKVGHNGVAGGPRSVPYATFDLSFPSETTYTPVTLLPEAYHEIITEWLIDTAAPSIITVVQEAGPWNELRHNLVFRGSTWGFAFLNVFFLLKASCKFARILIHGRSRTNLRIAVFTLALLSILSGLLRFVFNGIICAEELFNFLNCSLFMVAFYLLLILWCTIESVIQMDYRMNRFKVMLHITFTVQFAITFILIILGQIHYKSGYDVVQMGLVIIGVTYSCFALLFLYYAVFFYQMRNLYVINPISFKTLTKLSKMSTASVIAMIFILVNHLVYTNATLGSTINGYYVQVTLHNISGAVCSGVILFMLGIRMPNEEDTKSGASLSIRKRLQEYMSILSTKRTRADTTLV